MSSPVSSSMFADLQLSQPVMQALKDLGYEKPSPIQAKTIPFIIEGRDVLGQAQTGTGKTAAFALPILSRIDIKQTQPQVLVLTPTRELAIQVSDAFARYGAHISGLRVQPIYGGQAYHTQLRAFEKGVHVVVGTPGRVMDLMRRGTLKLDQLNWFILDEADEMLRMGFIEDVEWILEHAPKSCQMALLSATMPKEVRNIAERYLKNPEKVTIEAKTATVATIEQLGIMVKGAHKLDAIARFIEAEDFDGIIIFVRTKNATFEVAEHLSAMGYSTAALNGDIQQSQRERIIQHLKQGKLDIVVATDVAARGLDVERLSHVFNYDIPTEIESYIHRIGRTGRAGREGRAILFVKPNERHLLKKIERATKQRITFVELPTAHMITEKRVHQFKKSITDVLATADLKFFENLIHDYQSTHDVPAEKIAAALVKMLDKKQPIRCREIQSRPSTPSSSTRGHSLDAKQAKRSRGKRDEKRVNLSHKLNEGMDRYRIEVGRNHGVTPRNIVGAIANEINLSSDHIGMIDIQRGYSFVDLPKGLSNSALQILKNVWVSGQQLNISKGKESVDDERPRKSKKRSEVIPKQKKKKTFKKSKKTKTKKTAKA